MPPEHRPPVADRFVRAVEAGALDLPLPGSGQTGKRWAGLQALGEDDPVLARLGEGHADALAILAELGGTSPPEARWGVWAAAPASLTATLDDTGWWISGDRPWCSGAAVCTHALVTAAAPDGIRLFAVANTGTPLAGSWPAVGMAASDSRTVRFANASATPVGEPGDYLARPGFWHGAIGVAACWYGGAVGVARRLLEAAHGRDDPLLLAHLGAVDATLYATRSTLDSAATAVDADPTGDARRLALRTRATVEAAATEVLHRVGRALGAGPLCREAGHAARVADLTVYLRQSHAERDLAALGADVAAGGDPAW
jgi:hypothetical protein